MRPRVSAVYNEFRRDVPEATPMPFIVGALQALVRLYTHVFTSAREMSASQHQAAVPALT